MSKIHHDIEFTVIRKKLGHAASMEEKISLLEQLVALNPRNPKNLALRRKYREEMENLRTKKSGRKKTVASPYDSLHYKRLVTIVGETNSGKSTLINRLAGSAIEASGNPFTTWHPEGQMITCRDVPVMMVELPAVYEGDNDEAKYRFIRNSTVVCICAEDGTGIERVVSWLNENRILPAAIRYDHQEKTMKRNDETVTLPAFAVVRSGGFNPSNLTVLDANDKNVVTEKIYQLLNIRRIYSLKQGEVQGKPVVFPGDRKITVMEFIQTFDKRLLTGMRRVKVIHHDSSVPDVPSAGPDYELNDGDIVEVVLK